MCELDKISGDTRIDPCMKKVIKNLNGCLIKGLKIVACCCGHNKYPMTILVKDIYGNVWDLFSSKIIRRKKRFYRRNKETGHYYIPETIK